jgi:hypothetical protein
LKEDHTFIDVQIYHLKNNIFYVIPNATIAQNKDFFVAYTLIYCSVVERHVHKIEFVIPFTIPHQKN